MGAWTGVWKNDPQKYVCFSQHYGHASLLINSWCTLIKQQLMKFKFRIYLLTKSKFIEMLITINRFHYYHIRQLWNLLPVWGACQYWQFELAQSQDCRNNLYQRTHVKSVAEKWIKSGIFSLSYTKNVGSLIHFGQAKLIVTSSSLLLNVTVDGWGYSTVWLAKIQPYYTGFARSFKIPTIIWIVNRMRN